MNWYQMSWAKTHDWYSHCTTRTDGSYIIWVFSLRPERGLCPFTDYDMLQTWAGY